MSTQRKSHVTTSKQPDLTELPRRVDRKTGAKLVGRFYFRVSPRTLERWPVAWRKLNGRSHAETVELFAYAASLLDAAPPIRGGSPHGDVAPAPPVSRSVEK
jgi:hypothetical protein